LAVTSSTPANLVIGAGDVYVDDAVLGASQDDNTYTIQQEFYVPDLNGVLGELVDTRYKTKETAVLKTKIPEISAAILAKMWPGSSSSTVGEVTTIDAGDTRRIPSTDYHDWELRVPGLNKTFGFLADNALNVGAIELAGKNAGNMAPQLELHSAWDPADLTTSPHRITITVPVSS
jgi:hypothetical protein